MATNNFIYPVLRLFGWSDEPDPTEPTDPSTDQWILACGF